MAINREELFAPIACVIRARDYEHALEILNDTDFGLTAGIITQSLATASDFKKASRQWLRHGESAYCRYGLPCSVWRS
jgi:aldehyde dehydrogenase (NAD+)